MLLLFSRKLTIEYPSSTVDPFVAEPILMIIIVIIFYYYYDLYSTNFEDQVGGTGVARRRT